MPAVQDFDPRSRRLELGQDSCDEFLFSGLMFQAELDPGGDLRQIACVVGCLTEGTPGRRRLHRRQPTALDIAGDEPHVSRGRDDR